MVFPEGFWNVSGPRSLDDVKVPCTNGPFIAPVVPFAVPVRKSTTSPERPPVEYKRTTSVTPFILLAFTEYAILLPPSVTVKNALPIAFVERFGGVADLPVKVATNCGFCANAVEPITLTTPETPTNVTITTTIKTLTWIFMGPCIQG